MKRALITAIFLMGLFFIPLRSSAALSGNEVKWTENGIFVQAVNGDVAQPQSISDGQGGSIFVYNSVQANNNYDIYAQRIDANGIAQWGSGGIAIESLTTNGFDYSIVSDGHHGAIIAWQDKRNGHYYDVYAQRIDLNGQIQWAANGIMVSSDANNVSEPKMISDGEGGAIITWAKSDALYASRITSAGSLQWGSSGVNISSATLSGIGNYNINIVTDGNHGAVILWQDDNAIIAQRVNADGKKVWSSNTQLISSGKLWYENKNAVLYNGNIFVILSDNPGTYGNFYLQKIGLDGKKLWSGNGVLISSASESMQPQIVADNLGCVVVSWVSFNGSIHKVYAQRIDESGNIKWTIGGIGVFDILYSHYSPALLADAQGNTYVTTYANVSSHPDDGDMYIQKINYLGELSWGAAGYTLASAFLYQYRYSLTTDSHNGIIIVWEDERNHYTNPGYSHDIYAQRISSNTVFTPVNILATPISAGAPQVIIKNYLGNTLANFYAYDSSLRFSMTAVSIDLGTDGIAELITAPGKGYKPLIRLYDSSGHLINQFMFYAETMKSGLNMAADDIDGDGRVEIITVPKTGASPQIRIFDSYGHLESQFYAYAKSFRGGVNIALADTDHDGCSEIITVPESNGGPEVRIFEKDGTLVSHFWAYSSAIRGGYNLSIGDVNEDGFADIIITPKAGLGPQVAMFEGNGTLIRRFFAYAGTFRGGLHVSVGDVNADGINEIIATPESKAGPHLRVFNTSGVLQSQFYAYSNKLRGSFTSFIADVNADGINEIITAPGQGMGPHVRVFDMWGNVISQFFTHHTGFRGGINISPAY